MLIDALKNKYIEIKKTKEYAKKHGVYWYQSLLYGFFVTFFCATIITMYLYVLESHVVEYLNNDIVTYVYEQYSGFTLPVFMVAWFYFTWVYFIKAITWCFGQLNKYITKAVMYGIDKLDLYWFRKYKTHSPVTNFIDRLQTKVGEKKSKLNKTKKRIVVVLLIVALVAIHIWARYPVLVEMYNDTMYMINQSELEDIQSDPGKIVSPISNNPLLQDTINLKPVIPDEP